MQEEIRELTQEEIAEVAGGQTTKGGGGLICLFDRIEDRIECSSRVCSGAGQVVLPFLTSA
jgi:hypothetical protein